MRERTRRCTTTAYLQTSAPPSYSQAPARTVRTMRACSTRCRKPESVWISWRARYRRRRRAVRRDDGGARLWSANGLWRSRRVGRLYPWRAMLRVLALSVVAGALLLTVPA